MADRESIVDLAREDGLLRLLSTSSTVYYLDFRSTRPQAPLLMRARGRGTTARGPHDGQWVRLALVTSGSRVGDGDGTDVPHADRDHHDQVPWMLRVGSRHRFDYRVPGAALDTTDWWWIQRPLTRIERLDEMPPVDDLTVPETDYR